MKAMKIFSIFIKYLKDSLLETMNKGYKQNRIFESDIDFVLVVPAVCGDGAETFMQEAAINVRWMFHKMYSGNMYHNDLNSDISKPDQYAYV